MMNSDTITGGKLFRKGDFRDTIAVYNTSEAIIRFTPKEYTGQMMVHCHNLYHEDTGCV